MLCWWLWATATALSDDFLPEFTVGTPDGRIRLNATGYLGQTWAEVYVEGNVTEADPAVLHTLTSPDYTIQVVELPALQELTVQSWRLRVTASSFATTTGRINRFLKLDFVINDDRHLFYAFVPPECQATDAFDNHPFGMGSGGVVQCESLGGTGPTMADKALVAGGILRRFKVSGTDRAVERIEMQRKSFHVDDLSLETDSAGFIEQLAYGGVDVFVPPGLFAPYTPQLGFRLDENLPSELVSHEPSTGITRLVLANFSAHRFFEATVHCGDNCSRTIRTSLQPSTLVQHLCFHCLCLPSGDAVCALYEGTDDLPGRTVSRPGIRFLPPMKLASKAAYVNYPYGAALKIQFGADPVLSEIKSDLAEIDAPLELPLRSGCVGTLGLLHYPNTSLYSCSVATPAVKTSVVRYGNATRQVSAPTNTTFEWLKSRLISPVTFTVRSRGETAECACARVFRSDAYLHVCYNAADYGAAAAECYQNAAAQLATTIPDVQLSRCSSPDEFSEGLDGICQPCARLTHPGHYESQPCGPATNAVHKQRTVCTECHLSLGTSTTDAICGNHATSCPGNRYSLEPVSGAGSCNVCRVCNPPYTGFSVQQVVDCVLGQHIEDDKTQCTSTPAGRCEHRGVVASEASAQLHREGYPSLSIIPTPTRSTNPGLHYHTITVATTPAPAVSSARARRDITTNDPLQGLRCPRGQFLVDRDNIPSCVKATKCYYYEAAATVTSDAVCAPYKGAGVSVSLIWALSGLCWSSTILFKIAIPFMQYKNPNT